jgi:predicted MFS family arabinose efflux permease
MGFDIRLPIGLLFTILGLFLSGFGVFTGGSFYERSLGINVNLWWGLVLLIFGVLMTILAMRARRSS